MSSDVVARTPTLTGIPFAPSVNRVGYHPCINTCLSLVRVRTPTCSELNPLIAFAAVLEMVMIGCVPKQRKVPSLFSTHVKYRYADTSTMTPVAIVEETGVLEELDTDPVPN